MPQDWARMQNNLGAAYFERILGERAQNIELVLEAYTAALRVYTQQAFPQDWARMQINLGAAYFERIRGEKAQNIELAIEAYTAALNVLTEQAFPQEWALAQNNLGAAYFERILEEKAQNIELAIEAYTAALRVYTQQAFPQNWGRTQNNLGGAYVGRILGEKAKNIEVAIEVCSAALNVLTEQAFPQDWARMQNILGGAYFGRILGEKAKNIEWAIEAYTAALRVYTQQAFPQNWALTQSNLGAAYAKRILGDRAKNIEWAIEAYTAALNVYTQQAFPQNWALTQHNLGDAYVKRILGDRAKNIELAIEVCFAALNVYTQQAFPQDWARTQHNLGNAYRVRILGEKAENIELAIEAYSAALSVRTQPAFPQNHAECLWGLGISYQDRNDFTSAYNTFESAITTVESLREEIVSGEETKRKQAEEWNKLYSCMVEVCLKLNNKTQAIEYVERSKTRNLVEQILTRDSKTFFPADVVTQLETYRNEIAIGQDKIQNGKVKDPKVLAQHLQELRQQRNELQNPYLRVGYGFKFDLFQVKLDEHTAIIEWYILNDKILAFIVTKQGEVTVCQSQPEDQQALYDWVNQYLQNYYNQNDQWRNNLGEALKELASILHIDEILTQIPKHCDKLILIPHQFLHLFPLHAIPINQNSENSSCLLDLFVGGVSYAPSCQLLQQVQQRKRPDFQSLFAIQNPTEDLNYTNLEVESILSYFLSHQVLSKNQATKAALSQAATQLKEANYLHFSCHGSFNFNDPQNSFLLLADAYISPIPDDANPERYLKVSDTEAVDLSKCLTLGNLFERTFDFSQTRLVVLSACETGLTDFYNTSDEYIGLPSGFLYAGSSSVVSSLWTVNDLSTSFLMIKFIQLLKDATDMSIPLAMNQAQRWLRDATKEELQEWVKKLALDSTKKGKIRRQINNMTGEQPFNSPFHWAAFTAVGK